MRFTQFAINGNSITESTCFLLTVSDRLVSGDERQKMYLGRDVSRVGFQSDQLGVLHCE